MNKEAKEKALAFLKKNFIGVLGTISPEGKPRSRLVYYACDDYFTVYFSTLKSMRKYIDLLANPNASFTVATEDIPQTLQVEGVVSEVTDEEKMQKGLALLIDPLIHNNTYNWPVTKLNSAEVVLMQLKPNWIRWGDFTLLERGETNVYTELL